MGDDLRTLARHCYSGVCHCDWRLSLEGCEESDALKNVNISLIATSGVLIVIGIPLTFYRLSVKGHSLWTPKASAYGFFRPRPVDCMLVFFLIFNILKLLSAAVLVTDIFPNNWVARAYIYELPYNFGIGGITLYLIGISQTISQSVLLTGWLPSPIVVDVLGGSAFILPFIVNIPISIASGALAESDLHMAEVLIHVAHIAWFIWTFSIGGCVLYMIIRLVRILKIQHQSRCKGTYTAVKTGIVKIQVIGGTFVVCLWGYSTVLLTYAVLRDRILSNGAACVFFTTCWAFIGATTSLVAQISAIVSHKGAQNNPALQKTNSSKDDTKSGVTFTSTCPDIRGVLGERSTDHAAVTFYDDNQDYALEDALKASEMYKEWLLYGSGLWGSTDNLIGNPEDQVREPDVSNTSQLQLTAYKR